LYKPSEGAKERAKFDNPSIPRSALYGAVNADHLCQYRNIFTLESNVPEPAVSASPSSVCDFADTVTVANEENK